MDLVKGGKLNSSNMQQSLTVFPALPVTTPGQWAKGSPFIFQVYAVVILIQSFNVSGYLERSNTCCYKLSGFCWRPLKNHVLPL